jgi:LmbE family N-acetylglucosaminyl deacetylase
MNFKKIAISTLTAATLLFSGFGSMKTEAAEKPRVIFYVPHQDDELLSMGASIINHVNSGQEVHLVLYTNGTASYMRKVMNMNPRAFQQARNKEFILSAVSLGVKTKNIHFENLQDGSVTKTQARLMILKYNKKFPHAKHKAYSYYDKHSDHRVGGEALLDLHNEGKILDARFYVNHGRYDTPGFEEYVTGKGSYMRIKMAVNAYNINKPKAGLYGIGFRSAGKEMFDNILEHPMSVVHKPNQ